MKVGSGNPSSPRLLQFCFLTLAVLSFSSSSRSESLLSDFVPRSISARLATLRLCSQLLRGKPAIAELALPESRFRQSRAQIWLAGTKLFDEDFDEEVRGFRSEIAHFLEYADFDEILDSVVPFSASQERSQLLFDLKHQGLRKLPFRDQVEAARALNLNAEGIKFAANHLVVKVISSSSYGSETYPGLEQPGLRAILDGRINGFTAEHLYLDDYLSRTSVWGGRAVTDYYLVHLGTWEEANPAPTELRRRLISRFRERLGWESYLVEQGLRRLYEERHPRGDYSRYREVLRQLAWEENVTRLQNSGYGSVTYYPTSGLNVRVAEERANGEIVLELVGLLKGFMVPPAQGPQKFRWGFEPMTENLAGARAFFQNLLGPNLSLKESHIEEGAGGVFRARLTIAHDAPALVGPNAIVLPRR